MKAEKHKIAIIGLGLIGGSLAKSLRGKVGNTYFIGVDRNINNANKALELGMVDEVLELDEAVEKSDFVILATPVDVSNILIVRILDKVKWQTVIDVGSTKKEILDVVKNHPKRVNFVATHPMAGTEFSGPESAVDNLFCDKIIILCDIENSDKNRVKEVENLYKNIGAKIKYMNSTEHDISAAYVSHISHISSFALAITVLNKEKDTENIASLASGGFRSTVRLAVSDKNTWEAIFSQNKENVIEVVDNYIENMILFRRAIKNGDTNGIKELIGKANKVDKVL